MLKYRMKIKKNKTSYIWMIACLRLQVKFYFILTHNNLIFIRKIIGSLGVAVKKKFGGGVFDASRQKHPSIYYASRLFPKTFQFSKKIRVDENVVEV